MRSDLSIKEDVLDELKWQPIIDETEIGVVVKDGIVTLSGTVDSYLKKMEAEEAAKSVAGVKAVAVDIDVKYGNHFHKTDSEIATAVVNALKWNVSVPQNKIDVKVENGWVYLTGEVLWEFQKDAAKNAIKHLPGIIHVENNITLKNRVDVENLQAQIKKAFERSADIDADNINIVTDGHTVKLTGKVHSLKEKEDARRAAYYGPGVWEVKNELEVEF